MYKKKLLTNYLSEMEKSYVEGETTSSEKLSSSSEVTSTSLIFKGNKWVRPISPSTSPDSDK